MRAAERCQYSRAGAATAFRADQVGSLLRPASPKALPRSERRLRLAYFSAATARRMRWQASVSSSIEAAIDMRKYGDRP